MNSPSRLERQFWQNVPIRSVDWADAAQQLREPEAQDLLLVRLGLVGDGGCVVGSQAQPAATIATIQPHQAYTARFLKHLVALLENDGAELSDALYEAVAVAAASVAAQSECLRRYWIPPLQTLGRDSQDARDNRCSISVHEHVAAISQGTTGLRTWQAGLRLIEHFAAQPHLVCGRRIVELGAGVGLLGMACLRIGAASVTMTDVDATVLACLDGNIHRNWPQPDKAVAAAILDWNCSPEQFNEFLNKLQQPFDMLVAADVVYSPDLVPLLVGIIAKLLRAASDPSTATMWIASTRRQMETFELFEASLMPAGLCASRPADLAPASFYYYEEGSENISILCIRLCNP